MTGHPALLAVPPPLADSNSQATDLPPSAGARSIVERYTPTKGDNAAPQEDHADGADHKAIIAPEVSAEPIVSAGSKGGFTAYAMDLAFGPNSQKTRVNLEAFGKELEKQMILPQFAFFDSQKVELNLSLPKQTDRTDGLLKQYRDRYFAIKAENA